MGPEAIAAATAPLGVIFVAYQVRRWFRQGEWDSLVRRWIVSMTRASDRHVDHMAEQVKHQARSEQLLEEIRDRLVSTSDIIVLEGDSARN